MLTVDSRPANWFDTYTLFSNADGVGLSRPGKVPSIPRRTFLFLKSQNQEALGCAAVRMFNVPVSKEAFG